MKGELKDIAPKAVTIDKDRRLSYAIEMMGKHNIARLPVTEDGELVGIITERDIVEKIGSSRSLNFRTSSFHVSSCMTSEPVCVDANTPMDEVLHLFQTEQFSGLPVLDDPLRIITKTDMLRHFAAPGYVSENMEAKFFILRPEDRVVHARRVLLDNNLHSLPVWESGELLGLVTIQDIVFGLNEFREKTPGKYMESRLKDFTVDLITTRDIRTAKLEDSLNDVKAAMVADNFSSMPVLNYDDHIVGIISKDEIVNAME